jgi:peptidyl-prolyl cis-trans isomerase A (cyclophilin A)
VDLKTITPSETQRPLKARFETSKGNFTIELFYDYAPRTCQNFIDLAEGKVSWVHPRTGATKDNTPFYNGLVFHRIISGFMIQGGCPRGDGRGGPNYRFADEFHPKARHDRSGILSMANAGPDSNGSQFFITLGAQPHLDDRHTVFGVVCDGHEVVEEIGAVATDRTDHPIQAVSLKSVAILRGQA